MFVIKQAGNDGHMSRPGHEVKSGLEIVDPFSCAFRCKGYDKFVVAGKQSGDLIHQSRVLASVDRLASCPAEKEPERAFKEFFFPQVICFAFQHGPDDKAQEEIFPTRMRCDGDNEFSEVFGDVNDDFPAKEFQEPAGEQLHAQRWVNQGFDAGKRRTFRVIYKISAKTPPNI